MPVAKNKQVGAKIPEEVMERLRDCVWFIGQGSTINRYVEEAIIAKCEELERIHNGGKRYPPRGGELPKSNKKNE